MPRIANARGTPGTLGCFALTLDDRKPVMLTSEHVLFGAGGREQEPVWLIEGGASTRVARTRHGRRGTVHDGDADLHVDCATAELECVGDLTFEPEAAGKPAAVGDAVHQIGAVSGVMRGAVARTNDSADGAYRRPLGRDARADPRAPRIDPARPFNTAGDSGAALRNERGAVVGLVWGRSADGGALACPIAPVLRVLHVQLARMIESGAR